MSKTNIPVRPNDEDAHSHHHVVLHERVLEGKGLLIAGANVVIRWNGSAYVIEGMAGTSQTPVAPLSYGEWSPDATYNFNDIVKISLGPAQGTYIYVNSTPSKGNLPWVGAPFWSQLIGGLTSMWQ
jgi:hypothetical protein